MSYEVLQGIIRGRRSVRAFKPDPVPPADVERMLDAALWAPSGSNTQPWFFTAVSDRTVIARAADLVRLEVERVSLEVSGFAGGITRFARFAETGKGLARWGTFFEGAPLVFFVAGRREQSSWRMRLAEVLPGHPAAGEGTSWLVSCAAAVQNLLLAVHALGYGACWMGAPLVARVTLEELLELPEGYELLAVVPVGRSAEEPSPPRRRPTGETVRLMD
ncbi:MAG: nitroreductase family protein [bacterium]|nr:nitroreductase family protein [bacterium]